VGDRYILERMLSDDYNFGGEQSGHIIFLDHNTTGDGLISTLQVMALMRRTEKSLSRLAEQIPLYPQTLVNVRVREKKDLAGIAAFQQALRTHDASLNGCGRILVRYSGTEPLVRIMVEAEDPHRVQEIAQHLAHVLRTEVGEA